MTIKTVYLPDVLLRPRGAISMQRALKGIHTLIEHLEPVGVRDDAVQTALDDLELMLEAIAHGRDLEQEKL